MPVTNGHFAAVYCSFEKKPSKEEIIDAWEHFSGKPQELKLPHAPKQFLHYFTEDNMPQLRPHRDLEGGMAISLGRLREDTQYDYKFVGLSHNTLRGAAGARELQLKYLPLIHALFSDVNPIPVKEAMEMLGLQTGPVRLPLVPMAADKRAALKAELVRVGALKE